MSRAVVSADDVRAARHRGETRLAVPPGAIVTPLARDEAARSGIELSEEAGGEAGAASALRGSPTPGAHVPTCDPDDLERVVRRVRERVPDADPGQVREIARRVLEREGG